jgi:hypothetical protein
LIPTITLLERPYLFSPTTATALTLPSSTRECNPCEMPRSLTHSKHHIIMMLPHRPNGDSKSRLLAPLVRMRRPTELSPLGMTGAANLGIVPTRSSFSNPCRSVYQRVYDLYSIERDGPGHAHQRNPFPACPSPREISRFLPCSVVLYVPQSFRETLRGRVCVGIFLGSSRSSFF